jgi:hypothetical protein
MIKMTKLVTYPVTRFRVPTKMSSRTPELCVPQVETTGIEHISCLTAEVKNGRGLPPLPPTPKKFSRLATNQALGFTRPLTEMSTGNIKIIMFLGSKVRRVRRSHNLTAIYEPIV